MRQLRVGFLCSQNYLDRDAWSGIPYSMRQALEARDIQVVYLGNPQKYTLRQRIINRYYRTVYQLRRNKPLIEEGSPQYVAKRQQFVRKIHAQLAKSPCDVIFAPVSSEELLFLETDIPIVYLSDLTSALYWKYYDPNPSQQLLQWRKTHETAAISKASKIIYPSTWVADSAIHDLGLEPNKIEVIPFGANIDRVPTPEEIQTQRNLKRCRLLFVGRDWERKGGDIALQTLKALKAMGVDAELTIVGSQPHLEDPEGITVIPFLNKNDPAQLETFYQLFLTSNFFVFPTRAEGFGIVFCEAAAFGLPVVTTDVCGTPTIVRNGKNGYTLPQPAAGEDYARVIAKLFADPVAYQKLVFSSRQEYDSRLNWGAWAEQLEKVCTELVYSLPSRSK